jgi:hypothetical protein
MKRTSLPSDSEHLPLSVLAVRDCLQLLRDHQTSECNPNQLVKLSLLRLEFRLLWLLQQSGYKASPWESSRYLELDRLLSSPLKSDQEQDSSQFPSPFQNRFRDRSRSR